MLQTVTKWKVVASFDGRDDVVIWLYDNFITNIVRTIAGMDFSENGLEQPTQITVSRVAPFPSTSFIGVTTGGSAAQPGPSGGTVN